MKKVYNNLKMMRVKSKFSMAEMAEKLDINQSSYFQLEKGETKLTIERLYEIADIFKVSVLDLLGEKSKSFDDSEIEALMKEHEKLNAKIEELDYLKDYNKRLKEDIENYTEAISFLKHPDNMLAVVEILTFIETLFKDYNNNIRSYNVEYKEYLEYLQATSTDNKISKENAERHFKESYEKIFEEINSSFQEFFNMKPPFKIDAATFQRFIYFDKFLDPEYTNEQIEFLRNQYGSYINSKTKNP